MNTGTLTLITASRSNSSQTYAVNFDSAVRNLDSTFASVSTPRFTQA
jgi:hypothetical protein